MNGNGCLHSKYGVWVEINEVQEVISQKNIQNDFIEWNKLFVVGKNERLAITKGYLFLCL